MVYIPKEYKGFTVPDPMIPRELRSEKRLRELLLETLAQFELPSVRCVYASFHMFCRGWDCRSSCSKCLLSDSTVDREKRRNALADWLMENGLCSHREGYKREIFNNYTRDAKKMED